MWLVSLQVFERNEQQLPSEREKEILMSLFQKIITEVIEEATIRIVVILSGEVFEIFFYRKEADMQTIGGCIFDMKDRLEDREDRFIQFSGTKDPDWEKVSDIYNHIFKN
ncbi:hypothetical protein [Kordia sp.]|uniref:hypothetical protein n=1 Tax=Kordia sp. TaxID=1965332 RepID=UPI003D29A082